MQVKLFSPRGEESELELQIYEEHITIGDRLIKKESLTVASPLSKLPVIIELDDDSRIEIPHSTDLIKLLNDYKYIKKLSAFKVESNLKLFIGSLITCGFLLFILFKTIIPTSGSAIAKRVPNIIANKIDKIILEGLDKNILSDSSLSIKTKEKLKKIFSNHQLDKYNIVFRKGNRMKANAFALTNNTIILTDELINHLNQGKLILSVVLHEVAHLRKRHLLSQIITDSAIGIFSLYVFGDIAGSAETIAQLTFTLAARTYSQDHEKEADYESALSLKNHDLSPKCLSMSLSKLHAYYDKGQVSSIFDFLSTHPSLEERLKSLEKVFPDSKECLI